MKKNIKKSDKKIKKNVETVVKQFPKKKKTVAKPFFLIAQKMYQNQCPKKNV